MDYKNKVSIGVLISRDSNKFLLLLRPKEDKTIPNKWTFVAGKMEKGETPLNTIEREVEEELNFNSSEIEFNYIGTKTHNDSKLYYFIGLVDTEEVPTLNEENVDWGWYDSDNLPKNTYIECKKIIYKISEN